MKYFFLSRLTRIALLGLFAVMLLAGATIANAVEPKLDDDLHFTILPYIWLPSVNGKMKITLPEGSSSDNFKVGSSSYLDNLSFAAMLTMELEKGKWSFLTDILYIDFSDDNRQVTFPKLPGGRLELKADTGFKAWLIEAAPAYSLYRTESTRFDVLAGVRYLNLDSKADLDLSTPLPINFPSHNFSYKKALVDPIVGIKGRFELGKGWFIPYYLDAGGFGINDEWSWQAYGGLGYHFSKVFSMTLGYRYLRYNFDNNELLKDIYLSGGQLGFVFRF